MKYIIVGLGNPGRQYVHTRHNMGFDVLDTFAKKHKLRFRPKGNNALTASYEHFGEEVLLVKPQTYMNNSGLAVGELVRKYNLDVSRLFVIYDDMDLTLGKLRIRPKGSAGGHNGMKSIISHTHSSDFPRMRIGIGRGKEAISHVLSTINRKDKQVIDIAIEDGVAAIEMLLDEGLEPVMNKFNQASS